MKKMSVVLFGLLLFGTGALFAADNRPIGVFDSGTGGLTVLEKMLTDDFAHEKFVYLGDQANMPYGDYAAAGKSDFLRGLVIKDAEFLLDKQAKIVVIACNTATAYGYDAVAELLAKRGEGTRVIGVVNAGVRSAIRQLDLVTHPQPCAIGVMATPGTISSGVYARTIRAELRKLGVTSEVQVFSRGCAGLADAVEAGSESAPKIAGDNLKALMAEHQTKAPQLPLKAVILGCTHFPFVQRELEAVAPKGVIFVDPAADTARECAAALNEQNRRTDLNTPMLLDAYVSVAAPGLDPAKLDAKGGLTRAWKYGRTDAAADRSTKPVPIMEATKGDPLKFIPFAHMIPRVSHFLRPQVQVDFTRAAGPVKPLHGVNNGPLRTMKEAPEKWHQNEFKAAGIPFMRTHDTVGMWGGTHYVDIPNIFPNFEADENDPKNYDFLLTDRYLEPYVNAGVKIFYRLGVTIENFHWFVRYTTNPPKDFAKWARICEHVVRHYNDGWANGFRWNIEHWEIWNEPEEADPKGSAMWNGTKEQFFEMYRLAANEIKAKHPNVKVGSYGGLGFYAIDSKPRWDSFKAAVEWFNDFCAYVTDPKTKAPLDFFSWHIYVDQGFAMDRMALHARYARETLDRHGLQATESYLDEWNDVNGIWDRVCGEKRKYSDMKKIFGATSVAAGFAVLQSVPVDGAMYYDACPTRAFCGLFTFPDMETTACYSVFKAFNEFYRLGIAVPVAPAFGNGLYALAAKDKEGRQAIWLVNKNKSPVDLMLAIQGAAASYSVTRLEKDLPDFAPAGTAKPGDALTLPPMSITILRSLF